ncbi:hypothetical protein NPIL_513191 [Nephila pilipes]|uniref:Uncharacterized protein n=1 Tax=Nephila pilipes TaxID=299642 RepID=A0A8X6NB49_NEPPI|nr:hypothetical protein NPIL_513191 [Nephila pilipes]
MKLRSKDINDEAVWTGRNRINKKECGLQKSIRFGSWFNSSKLTIADEDYEHLKVNHTCRYVDPETQYHNNARESMWRHIKDSLSVYNRSDFKFYLAEFLLRASCEEKEIDAFNKFLELVMELDWTNFTNAD